MSITVQKGVAVMTGDTLNVTITQVPLERSFVIVDATTDTYTSSTGFQDWGVTGVLLSGTTLYLQRDGSTQDASVTWQVITCDQGEFLIVDRGAAPVTTGNTTATVSIPTVDLTRTMLIYNSRGNFDVTTTNIGFVTFTFTASNEFVIERGASSTTRTNTRYEVIEWSLESGVTVAHGVADGSGLTGTEVTSAHGATVTTTNTWLFAQSRHESNGLEQCAVRVRFDATNIIIGRFDTIATIYDSYAAWQLVTFPVSNCEQRTPSMASGDTVKDTGPTALTMDTGATIVWMTNNCDGTGTALGRNAWNSQVLNSTTIRSSRSYSGQSCEGHISICDFSLLTNSINILFLGDI